MTRQIYRVRRRRGLGTSLSEDDLSARLYSGADASCAAELTKVPSPDRSTYYVARFLSLSLAKFWSHYAIH